MGQHLDKAARGAYDALVYIEGSEVVAEDSNGRKIASGAAGTDDAYVTQFAIDLMNSRGGGNVYVSYHSSYKYSDCVIVKNKVRLEFARNTTVVPLNDIDVFQIKPESELHNVTINTSGLVSYSHNAILIDGTDLFVFFGNNSAILSNINLIGKHGTGNGTAIYFKCISSGGAIYNVLSENINIDGYEYGIRMYSATISNDINANVFSNIYGNDVVYFIHTSTESGAYVSTNKFYNVQYEVGDAGNPTITPLTLCNGGNYIEIIVYDWYAISGHANPIEITSGASGNYIVTNSTITNLSGRASNVIISSTSDSYVSKVIVSEHGGDFVKLSDALAATPLPTSTYPRYIEVRGVITESTSITLPSYTEIVGYNAVINITLPSTGNGVVIPWGTTGLIVRNVEFRLKASSSSASYCLSDVNYVENRFDGCKFLNDISGTYKHGASILSPSIFTDCAFSAGPGTLGDGVQLANTSIYKSLFQNCLSEGSNNGSGNAWTFLFSCSSELSNCSGMVCKNAAGVSGYSYYFSNSSRTKLLNCKTRLYENSYDWTYSSDNNGRFRPNLAYDLEILSLSVYLNTSNPGITMNIGTTPGGSDVASSIDLTSSSWNILIPITAISSTGYLYATPSAPITGTCILYTTWARNYSGSAMYIGSNGKVRIVGGHYISNISTPSTVVIDTTSTNYSIYGSLIESQNVSNNAIYSSTPVNGQNINNCKLYGLVYGVTGVDNKSSGSSTGTGSEQTIAHGLAAIPTGCKAWIKYLVGTRYITEMVPFDATNIYPTVTSGLAYEWRIE